MVDAGGTRTTGDAYRSRSSATSSTAPARSGPATSSTSPPACGAREVRDQKEAAGTTKAGAECRADQGMRRRPVVGLTTIGWSSAIPSGVSNRLRRVRRPRMTAARVARAASLRAGRSGEPAQPEEDQIGALPDLVEPAQPDHFDRSGVQDHRQHLLGQDRVLDEDLVGELGAQLGGAQRTVRLASIGRAAPRSPPDLVLDLPLPHQQDPGSPVPPCWASVSSI